MNCLYKLVIPLGFIFYTAGNNIIESTEIKYHMCYPNSKHCVLCRQETIIGTSVLYRKPLKQEVYRVKMMDKLNRARSQYAKVNGISNMRFAYWIPEFESLTSEFTKYDTPVIGCNLNGSTEINLNYKVLNFKSEMQLQRIETRAQFIDQEFQNFVDELLTRPDVMEYNLEDFGCSYSYDEQNQKLTTLMRCLIYTETGVNNSSVMLGKLCKDCNRTSERCIELDWYQGLCVYNRFNETRLRLIIDPKANRTVVGSLIYILIVIGLVLIICAVSVSYVICRRNNRCGTTHLPNQGIVQNDLPLIENIYSDI